jgi:hypothetical protein
MISPVLSWRGLQKHDYTLEIHLSKFCAPLDKKSRTNVKVELGKCVSPLRQVCIPHAYRILHTDFSHEQTIHPTECKLHKLDVLGLEVRVKWCIDTRHKLRHAFYATVNAWLGRYVVVLYTVQKSRETPE